MAHIGHLLPLVGRLAVELDLVLLALDLALEGVALLGDLVEGQLEPAHALLLALPAAARSLGVEPALARLGVDVGRGGSLDAPDGL